MMKKQMTKASVFFGLLILSFGVEAQSGQDMFDESYVHEIRVTFDDPNFWDSLTTHYNDMLILDADKKYVLASSVSIDGNILDSVGVRQKGFFSNWGAFGSDKKPLKLDFKEFKDQKYDGLKKINLANGFQDPSMLRDVVSYKLFREMGLRAPRTSYAKVFLNNQYWGLYIIVEQVDSEFLEDNFPANPDGNLYKCINNTSLDYQGSNWSAYEDEFELKNNSTTNDNTRFIDFVRKVQTTPAAQFKDSMNVIFESTDYLAVLACDILMYNWDSYYDHGRNFYMYLDPIENKFNWIPWDYNLSFSGIDTDIIVDYSVNPTQQTMVKRMQEDPEFRSIYFQQICFILLTKFNLTALETYIDDNAALIRPDLDADPNKFYSIANFDTNVSNDVIIPGGGTAPSETFPGIKSFISGRMNTVLSQLSNYGFSCVLEVEEGEELLDVSVYPNPVEDGLLTIDLGEYSGNSEISVFSIAGQKILESTFSPGKNEIDFSPYERGVYLISIQQGDELITKKVIKK